MSKQKEVSKGENKEVKMLLPTDSYNLFEVFTDNLTGVGCVNISLKDFEHKDIFPWNCRIYITFNETIDHGMPSREENNIVNEFEDYLNSIITDVNISPINGVFLGRLTYNSEREINWRIYDPKITDEFLKKVIENKDYPREFDYKIEFDPNWDLVNWYFGG